MNSLRIIAIAGLAIVAQLSPPAIAQTASDNQPGRLFFTPERRASLDRQRQYNIQEAQTLQGATMSLDGVVRRSTGKSTVWVNGRAQNENENARTGVSAALSAKTPGSAMLAPGEEAPSKLSVGEAMNRATGERNNRLGGGVIVLPATRR